MVVLDARVCVCVLEYFVLLRNTQLVSFSHPLGTSHLAPSDGLSGENENFLHN